MSDAYHPRSVRGSARHPLHDDLIIHLARQLDGRTSTSSMHWSMNSEWFATVHEVFDRTWTATTLLGFPIIVDPGSGVPVLVA